MRKYLISFLFTLLFSPWNKSSIRFHLKRKIAENCVSSFRFSKVLHFHTFLMQNKKKVRREKEKVEKSLCEFFFGAKNGKVRHTKSRIRGECQIDEEGNKERFLI